MNDTAREMGEKEAQKNTVFKISGYILIHRAQRKRGRKEDIFFSSTSKVRTEKSLEQLDKALSTPLR
jgi:hypothetical protein